MPSDDIIKSPDFDDSAKPGAKQALQKLTIWWDLKNYRRYVKALIGWSNQVAIHTGFQLLLGPDGPFLSDGQPIPKEFYEKQLAEAKKDLAYAEVLYADKDPDINIWESELIKEIAGKAKFDDQGQPINNLVNVPDNVKRRFKS